MYLFWMSATRGMLPFLIVWCVSSDVGNVFFYLCVCGDVVIISQKEFRDPATWHNYDEDFQIAIYMFLVYFGFWFTIRLLSITVALH